MKYEFVHRRVHDWNYEEELIINKTIDFVLELNKQQVLERLTEYIYQVTGVKCVCVSKTLPHDPNLLQTLVFREYGKLVENITYSILKTPCENVINNSICYYPVGIQEEFPEDIFLQHINVHSYMGIALKDSDQNTIGSIALLHEETIQNPGFVEHILTIIAPSLEDYLFTHSLSH